MTYPFMPRDRFDSRGFLYAHVSYVDEACRSCLLLISNNRDSDTFHNLSDCRQRVVKAGRHNVSTRG